MLQVTQVTHESLRRLITNDAPKRTYNVGGGPTVEESRMMLGISKCHTSDTTNMMLVFFAATHNVLG